jgi:hypothetical protein
LRFLETFDLEELLGDQLAGQMAIVRECTLCGAPNAPLAMAHAYTWQVDDGSISTRSSGEPRSRFLAETDVPPASCPAQFRSNRFGGGVFSEPIVERGFLEDVNLGDLGARWGNAALQGQGWIIVCKYQPDAFGKSQYGYLYQWYFRYFS